MFLPAWVLGCRDKTDTISKFARLAWTKSSEVDSRRTSTMECTYCDADVARSYETAASEAYAGHPDTRSTPGARRLAYAVRDGVR